MCNVEGSYVKLLRCLLFFIKVFFFIEFAIYHTFFIIVCTVLAVHMLNCQGVLVLHRRSHHHYYSSVSPRNVALFYDATSYLAGLVMRRQHATQISIHCGAHYLYGPSRRHKPAGR